MKTTELKLKDKVISLTDIEQDLINQLSPSDLTQTLKSQKWQDIILNQIDHSDLKQFIPKGDDENVKKYL